METPPPLSDDGSPANESPPAATALSTRQIVLIGLGVVAFVFLSLAGVVYLSFNYIRQTVQTTSLTLPLFAPSPVYNRIAFVGNDNNIWLVSPDGEERQQLTPDGQGYRFPTWAPDGRRLAFIGPGRTESPALYISPASDSEPLLVFDQPDSAPFYLYWGPDSRSITFLTQEDSELAMRQVEVNAPQNDRILGRGSPFYWVWSPQGNKLLMHVGGARRTSDQAHISLLDNQPQAQRVELNLAPGRFQAPLWSADGQFFYYVAQNEEGTESIYKTQVDSLEEKRLTNLSGFTFMTLSPDNRHLAYLQIERDTRAPFGRAYLVDTDGQNHQRLLDTPVASLYWSPDGKKLALLSIARPREGPTAHKINGLAVPLKQDIELRWWIYDLASQSLEPLISFRPTGQLLQTVPFFDQYHLSLTFWSPDSRYLTVTKKKEDSAEGTVWVYDTTGQEEPHQVGQGTLAVWSWQ